MFFGDNRFSQTRKFCGEKSLNGHGDESQLRESPVLQK